jgi:hypothetical protein
MCVCSCVVTSVWLCQSLEVSKIFTPPLSSSRFVKKKNDVLYFSFDFRILTKDKNVVQNVMQNGNYIFKINLY